MLNAIFFIRDQDPGESAQSYRAYLARREDAGWTLLRYILVGLGLLLLGDILVRHVILHWPILGAIFLVGNAAIITFGVLLARHREAERRRQEDE